MIGLMAEFRGMIMTPVAMTTVGGIATPNIDRELTTIAGNQQAILDSVIITIRTEVCFKVSGNFLVGLVSFPGGDLSLKA